MYGMISSVSVQQNAEDEKYGNKIEQNAAHDHGGNHRDGIEEEQTA